MFDVRLTSMLNTVSAYWHMAGVAIIVIVLIVVPDRHQSLSYVFTETVNNSGFGDGVTATFSHLIFWFVFGLGLLMAQYTITGFDASAHMAEETKNGLAHGRRRDVHVRRRLGDLRLDPAARGHSGDPEHRRRRSRTSASSSRGSGRSR